MLYVNKKPIKQGVLTTMSIIKRKKQDKFFLMSNHAAQENLTSLNSIGLLAYITSLPEDWILYKTFLQKKFTRRTVDSTWNELLEKKYIAGFSMYIDRKKQYFYLACDDQITHEDFNAFVKETFHEQHEKTSFIPKNLQIIKGNQFTIDFDFEKIIKELEESAAQNVQHSEKQEESECLSEVHQVQYNMYSTSSTEHNEQIQRNTYKEIEQKQTNKEINNVNNKQLYIKDISFFTEKILEEVNIIPSDPEAYFSSVIEMIASRRKIKLGITKPNVPFYNWLEA